MTYSFLFLAGLAAAATPPADHRNFVACPIVRDTQTVPCWLAEYDGELYYLGIQTDVNAEWTPPYLGHRVLVEGVIAMGVSRICGGIVLRPVVTSVFPELDAACNSSLLPAEDRYTVPFAPRGAGPARIGGTRVAPTLPGPPYGAKQFVVPYEFDSPTVSGKTSRVLQQAVLYARASSATHIEIVGHRAATLLSNSEVLVEKNGIAERRAKQIAELLMGVGIDASKINVEWREQPAPADGVKDFEKRRATILVRP